ncbi:transposase family protein, partial [Oceanobacillus limi]
MYMQFNMKLPGLESVIVTKMEELEGNFYLHVKLPVKKHRCPACGERTSRIHDYRIQKVQHLKIFERT